MIPRLGSIVAIVAGLALGGATLTQAAPPNDDCTTPTVIAAIPFVDTLNVSSATGALLDPILFCLPEVYFGPGSRTVWYTYTAGSEDVSLQLSTAGSTYDTILAVHRGTCVSPTTLACSDDQPTLGNASEDFVVVRAGETVLIEAASKGVGGTLQLSLGYAPVGHPVKVDPEFVVNTYTPGRQGFYYGRGIEACGDGNGGFVVAWEDGTGYDGDEDGVFARRFDAAGLPLGGQFQVNTYTTGAQFYPSVACGESGDFVVAWAGRSTTSSNGVQARRFDGTGAPVTGELEVSSGAGYPSATTGASGDFVVVFEKGGSVQARRYDATGTPQGAEFTVSSAAGSESRASGNAAGDLVVVWNGGYTGYAGYEVRGRQMDAGGTLGTEFGVATVQASYLRPGVATNAAGSFVVTWDGFDDDTFERRVMRRSFDAAASPLDAPTVVDQAPGYFFSSDVDVAADGSFVVAWDSADEGNIRARRIGATGNPVGAHEFQVETEGVYAQYGQRVAMLAGGTDFMVVWSGFDGYGDGCGEGFCGNEGVRARRFRLATAPPSGCPAAPAAGCRNPTVPLKAKLQIVDAPDPVYDLMRWNWVKGEATTVSDLDDPTVGESYSLCLYDASNTLIYGSLVPAGGTCGTKPCWKAVGDPPASRGYKYKSKERAPHGITKLTLKPGAAGTAKIVAKGGRENLFSGPSGAPPLPLVLPATMQLHNTSGECWQAVYASGGVVENTSAVFKGNGS